MPFYCIYLAFLYIHFATQSCEGPQAASKGSMKEEREANSDYEWNPTTTLLSFVNKRFMQTTQGHERKRKQIDKK